MSFKVPAAPHARILAAATATLVLFWMISGWHPHREDDEHLDGQESPPKLKLPFYPRPKEGPGEGHAHAHANANALSDIVLDADRAQPFCSHYHLEPHNGSLEDDVHSTLQPPPRKIYDLLVVTPTTSMDALEMRLAQMSTYVDYFVLMEAPSDATASAISTTPSESSPTRSSKAAPPILDDDIWRTRLLPYRAKIIRRSLSRSAPDFAPGLDHGASSRNAVYTQVIPLLTGPEAAELGDVLLVSEVEELVRPVTLKVLRNCQVPARTTIRTRNYWYSFQWMKMDRHEASEQPATAEGPQGSGSEPRPSDAPSEGSRDSSRRTSPGGSAEHDGASNEWWSHPQATVYQGPETILPNDLRQFRNRDEYVFADGGWTCQLCYGTIAEVLAKAGEMGLIWHDGPRWKSAGRVVDRVRRGIDLFDRANLSRVESNPDIPPFLQTNPQRFSHMVDRDSPGANFADFDAAQHDLYLARQKQVDAEKDTEDSAGGEVVWNLANTQAWNDAQPGVEGGGAPLPPGMAGQAPGGEGQVGGEASAPAQMSEEDKAFLAAEVKGSSTELTEKEIAILEQMANGGGIISPVYGEE